MQTGIACFVSLVVRLKAEQRGWAMVQLVLGGSLGSLGGQFKAGFGSIKGLEHGLVAPSHGRARKENHASFRAWLFGAELGSS